VTQPDPQEAAQRKAQIQKRLTVEDEPEIGEEFNMAGVSKEAWRKGNAKHNDQFQDKFLV
jgi:hypothetical protein